MDQNNTGDQYTESTHNEAAPAADTHTEASHAASGDMSNTKIFAIIGYILPFLFFLPLIQEGTKHDPFARFHSNQQLILLILWIGIYVLQSVFYMMFFAIAFALVPLLNLAVLVLAIIGIINAAQGNMKELPLVGSFKLLK